MDMMEAYTAKPVQKQVSTSFWPMVLHVTFLFFILLYSTVQENLTCSNFHGKFKNVG